MVAFEVFACFHVSGVMLPFSGVLYMLVRYASPWAPMRLRCVMLTTIRPCEVVFALCYCHLDLCCGEFILVVCRLCVFLSMCLFVLCVLCLLSVWVGECFLLKLLCFLKLCFVFVVPVCV